MSLGVQPNEVRCTGLGVKPRAPTPRIEIGFYLAARETLMNGMNTLKMDAHVLISIYQMPRSPRSEIPLAKSSAASMALKSHLAVPDNGCGKRPLFTQRENPCGDSRQ